MSTCAIRYRLNAPGPSAFIVECNGGMRMYTRGKLGARMAEPYMHALVGAGASRWVPASGELILDIELEDEGSVAWQAAAVPSASPFVRAGVTDLNSSSAMLA